MGTAAVSPMRPAASAAWRRIDASACWRPSRKIASSYVRLSAAARIRASSPTAASSTGARGWAVSGNARTGAVANSQDARRLLANGVRRRRQQLTHVLRKAGGRVPSIEGHERRLRGGEEVGNPGGGPAGPLDRISEG